MSGDVCVLGPFCMWWKIENIHADLALLVWGPAHTQYPRSSAPLCPPKLPPPILFDPPLPFFIFFTPFCPFFWGLLFLLACRTWVHTLIGLSCSDDTYRQVYIYIYIYVYVYVYVCIYIHIYIYIYICVYVYIYIHTYAKYVWYVYMYIYIYLNLMYMTS